MNYISMVVTHLGGPEVLRAMAVELREPARQEVRIKVQAASVCRPDVTLRRGENLYRGTFLAKKLPFVPGYSIIGLVDAIGPGVRDVRVGDRVGALMVTGGYSEYVYWRSDRLIPVPSSVDSAEAVTLILNYIVAYQALHRAAKARAGEKMLIIGASGGIGTALLELGRLAGLQMYGLASRGKRATVCQYGAVPVDYRTQDFAEVIRGLEPDGIDIVMDGMMTVETTEKGLDLLRRRGRMVSFGEPAGFSVLWQVLRRLVAVNLFRRGKSMRLYGTSFYFLGFQEPFLKDWATLFEWLEQGKLKPVIMKRFPILQAAAANELLESGEVVGNVVLVSEEWK